MWKVLQHIPLYLTFIHSVAPYSVLDCSDHINNPQCRIKYHVNPSLGQQFYFIDVICGSMC